MVISSFIDDSPGIRNNGQPLRLLDVEVMPAGFHPDTFHDNSPPLPGPRECTAIRLVQKHNKVDVKEITEPNRPMLGTPQHIATLLRAYMDAGFDTALVELPAPYDHQTMERLMLEVKPLVESV